VLSEGLALTVDEGLESVRSALVRYKGGQAFPEFKSASGEDVCVASAHVAYLERAPAEGEWRPRSTQPRLSGHPGEPHQRFRQRRSQSMNGSVAPRTNPPFISPPLLDERVDPISPALFRGYTLQRAVSSQRRRAAEQTVTKIVQEQPPDDEVRWARYPTQRAA
jgi:hypothetical protein